MRVALADVNEEQLKEAGKEVAAIAGEANVLVIPTDVSRSEEVAKLKEKVLDTWGEVSIGGGWAVAGLSHTPRLA